MNIMEVITKYLKYLPALFVMITSIIIFRILFKTYNNRKHTIEKFAEEDSSYDVLSLVNEIRTLIMNNETEYQNNMNQVLEKISTLENKLVAVDTPAQEPPTVPEPPTSPQPVSPPEMPPMTQQQVQTPTTPTTPTQVIQVQQPTAQQQVRTPTTPTTSTTPTQVIQVQQPTAPIEPQFAFDEDSDNESNTEDQITESFVDGISGGSTANCGVF